MKNLIAEIYETGKFQRGNNIYSLDGHVVLALYGSKEPPHPGSVIQVTAHHISIRVQVYAKPLETVEVLRFYSVADFIAWLDSYGIAVRPGQCATADNWN